MARLDRNTAGVYTIHIGPGMTLDGGPFGGTRIHEVHEDTIVLSHGGDEPREAGTRSDINDKLTTLLGETGYAITPVSKGKGVYSLTLDFSGAVFKVFDGRSYTEFDPEDASETRPTTMQRDFDRGRVTVEGR